MLLWFFAGFWYVWIKLLLIVPEFQYFMLCLDMCNHWGFYLGNFQYLHLLMGRLCDLYLIIVAVWASVIFSMYIYIYMCVCVSRTSDVHVYIYIIIITIIIITITIIIIMEIMEIYVMWYRSISHYHPNHPISQIFLEQMVVPYATVRHSWVRWWVRHTCFFWKSEYLRIHLAAIVFMFRNVSRGTI